MRGKVSGGVGFGITIRITPAYAGKRTDEKNRVIYARDHPRLCGEKELLKLEFDTIMGSPPPMRGKV